MLTNFYLFDTNENVLYGPSSAGHYGLMAAENLSHSLSELIDNNWVRIYYNQKNNELGISCNKNKFALKAIRNFVKKEALLIKSLFLDINDIHYQGQITNKNIEMYIKYGRIKPDQTYNFQ